MIPKVDRTLKRANVLGVALGQHMSCYDEEWKKVSKARVAQREKEKERNDEEDAGAAPQTGKTVYELKEKHEKIIETTKMSAWKHMPLIHALALISLRTQVEGESVINILDLVADVEAKISVVPAFKNDDFAEGVLKGLGAFRKEVAAEAELEMVLCNVAVVKDLAEEKVGSYGVEELEKARKAWGIQGDVMLINAGWSYAKKKLRMHCASMEDKDAWAAMMRDLSKDYVDVMDLLGRAACSLHWGSNAIERLFSVAKHCVGLRRAKTLPEHYYDELFVLINMRDLIGGEAAAVRDFVERSTRLWLLEKSRRVGGGGKRRKTFKRKKEGGLDTHSVAPGAPVGWWAAGSAEPDLEAKLTQAAPRPKMKKAVVRDVPAEDEAEDEASTCDSAEESDEDSSLSSSSSASSESVTCSTTSS